MYRLSFVVFDHKINVTTLAKMSKWSLTFLYTHTHHIFKK